MIVYLLTNKINGKQYVGQTIESLQQRWKNHCWAAFNKKHRSEYLICKALRKYGKDVFLVEQLDTAKTLDELNQKEKEWIAKLGTFGNGYNMTEGGGGIVGLRGERHGMWGKGHLVSGGLNPMFGKTGDLHPMFGKSHSEETKAKMRASHNHICGDQHWSTGKQITEETRQKMAAASKGRKQSAETIAKRVKKFTGALHPNAKTYQVTSPDGLEYVVKSLRHFCVEHGLNVQSMSNTVRRGTAITYGPQKGWKAKLL
jgi:group I intron endonuclease